MPGDPARHATVLDRWGLRRLGGGRNNAVFAWNSPDGDLCIKLYPNTNRRRVEREWHGLTHVAGLDIAPVPVWLDEHPEHPALAMTLVPGTPLPQHTDPAAHLKDLAEATRAMQAVPLSNPLMSIKRVDSIAHYITRLTDVWPQQLATAAPDAHTADMLALLRRWEHSGDAEILSRPSPRVFSRGDANLLNWHHDGHQVAVVDFEFSGHSDVAVDAADHIEHISARGIPASASTATTAADSTQHNEPPRCAGWPVLWKRRDQRVEQFTTQRDRAHALLG